MPPRKKVVSAEQPEILSRNLSLTYPDVGLPGEGAEAGLVAPHDPPLRHVPPGGVEAAPVAQMGMITY